MTTQVYDVSNECFETNLHVHSCGDKRLAMRWSANVAAQALFEMLNDREGANDLTGAVYRLPESERPEPDKLVIPRLDSYDAFCQDLGGESEQPAEFTEIKLLPLQAPLVPEPVALKDIWPQVRAGVRARNLLREKLLSRKRKREDRLIDE